MHIVEKNIDGNRVKLEDISVLGHYEDRRIEVGDYATTARLGRPKRDQQAEMARVTEVYLNGDYCPKTGESRQTTVNLYCCSPRTTGRQHKSSTLLFGIPTDITLASIAAVREDTDCRYAIDVCTPLLCEDTDTYEYDELLEAHGSGDRIISDVKATAKLPANMEVLSIHLRRYLPCKWQRWLVEL
jgi:hypothetical protein